eukprot:CAMPEP_0184702600 /NCGR_PEP_ID=MMETSP0313-20130426/24812_1 /TAXON_ID=2792 /ORGANISM="Porphyridium aerugineum, Strain SAG 1380-2" /LENGTH=531 /DNA_ID=CAMNT_0027163129 /DNA_START=252 /DNA_END=1847 /DNA_ORIENTATION=+
MSLLYFAETIICLGILTHFVLADASTLLDAAANVHAEHEKVNIPKIVPLESAPAAAADSTKKSPKETPKPLDPDWDLYTRSDALLDEMKQYGDTCRYASYETIPIPVKWNEPSSMQMIPGVDSGSIQMKETVILTLASDVKSNVVSRFARRLTRRKLRVLAVFGTHGRELVTSEIARYMVKSVCDTSSDSMLFQSWRSQLEDIELVLVPLLNVYGRHQVENGQTCSRLNENNVDINRNFNIFWGQVDDTTISAEERPGSKPHSEYQTRAIVYIATRFKPHLFLNFHSGDVAVVLPLDGSKKPPPAAKITRVREVIQHVQEQGSCTECAVGHVFKLFGYNGYGTMSDYLFDVVKTPLVYTIEVYGDLQALAADCYRMFNPIDRDSLNDVLSKWSVFVFRVMAAAKARIAQERSAARHDSEPGSTHDLQIDDEDDNKEKIIPADLRRQGYGIPQDVDSGSQQVADNVGNSTSFHEVLAELEKLAWKSYHRPMHWTVSRDMELVTTLGFSAVFISVALVFRHWIMQNKRKRRRD